MSPRRVARPLAAAAALIGVLALPSAAPAATVRVEGTQLRFVAEANEANAVTFERTASAFRVHDAGADIDAAAGCTQVSDNIASCPHATVESIRATLGDENDSAAVEGSTPSQLFGQQGTDALFGSNGEDTLDAGPGEADFLAGREGDDMLTATNATGMVKLEGGPGDDTLRGNDRAPDPEFFFAVSSFLALPVFVGGEGNDTITGSDIGDALSGGPGADTLAGGTGGLDVAFYQDRTEDLTVNLANGGATDGGATDAAVVDGTTRRDSITGVEGVAAGTGSDTLTGTASADLLAGSTGSDTLNGSGGDDLLCGEGGGTIFADPDQQFGAFATCFSAAVGGDDVLNGGPDNDTLYGGVGADTMNGGPDSDGVLYNDRNLSVRASIEDTCNGAPCAKNNDGQEDVNPGIAGNQGERDRIGLDVEHLAGGTVGDVLKGSPAANRLEGGEGDDELIGGDGDDRLCGDGRSLFLGSPFFRNNPCADLATPGDDSLEGEGGDDVLAGNRGRDMLSGGADEDTATWQERSGGIGLEVTIEDSCAGTPCAKNNDGQTDVDPVTAGDQGERDRVALDVENLIGSSGPDSLAGSNDANLISGGSGTDDLNGLGAADVLEPNGGVGDVVDGGPGRDFVSYRFESTPVNVTLDNVANDGGSSVSPGSPLDQNVRPNVEGILGTPNGDILSGPVDPARNTLLGYGGFDTLRGFAGEDTLDGGNGPDALRGGTGNDLLSAADRVSDVLVDCDDGAAPGGGPGDRVVFDDGLETPVNCESMSPVAIAAAAGTAGGIAALEAAVARQHRLAKPPSKAARRALRRAQRDATR